MSVVDAARQRSWWGWGYDDAAMSDADVDALGGRRVGPARAGVYGPPGARAGRRRAAPATSRAADGAGVASARPTRRDRAGHTYGRSYRDVVRGFHRQLAEPARRRGVPARRGRRRRRARLVLGRRRRRRALRRRVVGGRRRRVRRGDGFGGVVSIDLTGLDRVLEIDRTQPRRAGSRPARSGRCSRTSCGRTG